MLVCYFKDLPLKKDSNGVILRMLWKIILMHL